MSQGINNSTTKAKLLALAKKNCEEIKHLKEREKTIVSLMENDCEEIKQLKKREKIIECELSGVVGLYQKREEEIIEKYNKSASFAYVSQLLELVQQLEKNSVTDQDRIEDLINDLNRNNTINDLKKENQELRNKIVRMA